jgi:hypothetical protein
MPQNNVEESLLYNLDTFSFDSSVVNSKSPKRGLRELMSWAYKEYADRLGTDVIPIIDNNIQLDGAFFSFCQDNEFKVESLVIDSITVLSGQDNDLFDPFVIQGAFSITCKNFSFIKCSLFYKTTEDTDQVSSFILISAKEYEKYIELKTNYSCWTKCKEGITVKVVGGDDFFLDNVYTWDKLFFGEKKELKEDLKSHIDNFFESEDVYDDADIPWKNAIFVHGLPGNGKTELINTIICEYGLDPVTVTSDNLDDSILELTFNFAGSKERSIVYVENVDELINENTIEAESITNLIDSFDSVNSGNGVLVLLSAVKMPEVYKDVMFKFDKQIELGFPEYTSCINNLFGRFFSDTKLNLLREECKKNHISYGFLERLYKLFAKNMLYVEIDKEKDDIYFEELMTILKHITKESDLVNKKYMKTTTKKLGLGKKTKESN